MVILVNRLFLDQYEIRACCRPSCMIGPSGNLPTMEGEREGGGDY